MSGDVHVRFCESQELQYPWPLTFIKKKGKCVKKTAKKAKKSARANRRGK